MVLKIKNLDKIRIPYVFCPEKTGMSDISEKFIKTDNCVRFLSEKTGMSFWTGFSEYFY
jgi:hypothetical protein